MPVTTRSANKQTKLEDVGAGTPEIVKVSNQGSKRKAAAPASLPSKKRKSTGAENKPVEKVKQTKVKDVSGTEASDDTVIINRAPVLELWASCVAHFLHPSLSWATCLSTGGAISTITAISKGRSIGTMQKPDPGDAEPKRQKREERAKKEGLDEVEVMSFKLRLDKDSQAMVGGKAKEAGEEALKKKYGAEQYDKVKGVFEEALNGWKSKEHELDGRAFSMYEDFRPNIPPGQKGWGRKGQLRLQAVRDAVQA